MFIDHGHHLFLQPIYGRQKHIALLKKLARFCFGRGFYKHCAATRLKWS